MPSKLHAISTHSHTDSAKEGASFLCITVLQVSAGNLWVEIAWMQFLPALQGSGFRLHCLTATRSAPFQSGLGWWASRQKKSTEFLATVLNTFYFGRSFKRMPVPLLGAPFYEDVILPSPLLVQMVSLSAQWSVHRHHHRQSLNMTQKSLRKSLGKQTALAWPRILIFS